MSNLTSLDVDFVRSQFPAFSEPDLAGQAFFENAGGSYTCAQVINRLMRYYHQRKVQPYEAYTASRLAGEEMDEARTRLSSLMGVEQDELSFGPSTSQNTYVLAQAFRGLLKPGDAIVVTNQDHEANSGVWRRLKDDGIEVREWALNADSGSLEPEELKSLLDDRTKLVCFPHCSNVIAEINPVREICDLAHSVGAFACVDGVSYAPHGLPNVEQLGADIYLFSTYKIYGPHQGVMVVRRALADQLPNQGHFFNAGTRYKRFTPAGPDHAQIAACAGIADYIDALYDHHVEVRTNNPSASERMATIHDMMRARETQLQQPLLDYLGQRNNLRLLGPREAARRAPTIAVALDDVRGDETARLAEHGIMAGRGDFYAVRPLSALGINTDTGVLRLSFVHYTHEDEIAQLIRALDQAI